MKQAKRAYKKKKVNQDQNLNCLGCSLLARQRKQRILEHLGNWACFRILHALSFHTENHQIEISAAYANIKTLANFGLLVNAVPVSYTHLDVYKRQVHLLMPEISSINTNILPDTIK